MDVLNIPAIAASMAATAALPTTWNIVARNEYRNKTITKLFGSQLAGAYFMAAWIFCASLGRDWVFNYAVEANAGLTILDDSTDFGAKQMGAMIALGYVLVAAGLTLVVTSFLRLGITGTYLGDYFGILMKERVTAFPFSHFENPMYTGATMAFLGAALYSNSIVGVFLSGWVWSVYQVSCIYYENPFTGMIYEKAAEAKKKAGKSQ